MLRLTICSIACFIFLGALLGFSGPKFPEKLSEWKIFEGKLSLLRPAKGVVPYNLNTPLYSDYAEKKRFIRLPFSASVTYKENGVLDFPTGTILIKNFYYSADFRRQGINKNIIETRLLIHEPAGWKAITYVWNEKQTEAFLEIAGDDKQVRFIDMDGNPQEVRYVVPNQNQCKGCHNYNEKIMPIGLSVSQLNGSLSYAGRMQNQIDYWKAHRMLVHVPKKSLIPKTPVWNDSTTGDLNARARAYLAINCAHCHRREGPAQTSGLFFTADEKNPTTFGINKTPVAAGKGSGGRMVDISPGHATASILWYRMHSTSPGERMPELGRNMIHKEGLALVEKWINTMDTNQ